MSNLFLQAKSAAHNAFTSCIGAADYGLMGA
jgi:hypothetical protein